MAFWRKSVISMLIGILYFLYGIQTVQSRVAGKAGGGGGDWGPNRSYKDWNDVLIMVSIGMAITIGILIALALCYIACEKCQKHREYYVTA